MHFSEAGLNRLHLTSVANAGIKWIATSYDSLTTFLR